MKTFVTFSDCLIKTRRSLKRRAILKIPSKVFQKNPCFLLALKWKLKEKALSNVKTKTNSSFAVKVTEKKQPLLSIWWITHDNGIICTIIELKELNWLCKHMKNVRSSQPCISANFCNEFNWKSIWHFDVPPSFIGQGQDVLTERNKHKCVIPEG